ncbi:MAG: glycoside hydrolase family 9 protein, partial [Cyanobacteria bacterium J06642_3]
QKTALLINNQNSAVPLELLDSDTEELVATLPLTPEIKDESTGDRIIKLDFSSTTQPGTYYLKQNKLRSPQFKIGEDIYQQPLVTLLRSYYLQRCGVELDDPVTGISHVPCHLNDGLIAHQDQFHQASEFMSAVGGWHDGAAYSKYVASTTVTIARLLHLYQQYPDRFPDGQLAIPESDNNISDLLDEMKFGLDWLLKMQRTDGAVYRKVAGQQWAIAITPDTDLQARYIYGISTPETAKFAAVMAIASRIYQSIDSDLAITYLQAAESAWQYLQTQPEMKVDWVEGDDSGSQKYLASASNTEASLQTDTDDRFWAAAELYIATGKANFSSYFAEHLDQMQYSIFDWKHPVNLALVNYATQKQQPATAEFVAQIKSKIRQRADLVLAKVKQSPYHTANDNFIWDSNRITAEEGITLFYAYQLTQNKDYLNAATDQLNYLLGCNHFNQTFVTGIGENPVKRLNHPFAIAKRITIPGLVVGGPNEKSPDAMVLQNRGQLSYVDDNRSYATNQYAINNNASVISLIANLTTQN